MIFTRSGGTAEEAQHVGREYFARAPGNQMRVWFGDLPEATSAVLREKAKLQRDKQDERSASIKMRMSPDA
jgi:hypothetical protein